MLNLDILNWLEKQRAFLSPPDFITQQNTSINPEKYRLINVQEIGNETVADYEILSKFMWVRFKKIGLGWHYISSCVRRNGVEENTTDNLIVCSYLSKCLFNCKLFEDVPVFCIEYENTFVPDKKVEKSFNDWVFEIKHREDVFMSFSDLETPHYILSDNKGIYEYYMNDYERINHVN